MTHNTRLLFDCHLDISMNALEYNRDQTWTLEKLRRSEIGMSDYTFRARGVVTFPEMRKGKIGLCVATQIGRYVDEFSKMPGWHSPQQAWASTQGQLAYYREMERIGQMRQLTTGPQVQQHAQDWIATGGDKMPIGYVLSLEGADSIVSMKHLEIAWQYGLRAIGLTHYGPGIYGHGTDDHGPLTAKGHELLKEMGNFGMILDATHLCDESFRDAIDRYDGPIWSSHTNCRSIANWNRQFTDGQIRELLARDAVLGMSFDAIMMVDGWNHTRSMPQDFQLKISKIIEHIDHICQLAGDAKHIGIGSDLDGGYGTEQTPMDLNSIADLTTIADLLAARGYPADDIDGIMYKNFVDFLVKHLPKS